MNLAQIIAEVDRKSYYSRTADDILSAINAAQRWMYDWIMKENRGYWIKWDTTTVALANGIEEYVLPADLQTMLRMRERPDANSDWALMEPASGLTAQDMIASIGASDLTVADGPVSPYVYFGPYLLAADAQADPQSAPRIRVGPIPNGARLTELVYVAKFVELVNEKSFLMIPDEGSGRTALIDFAIEEAVRANSDNLAETFHASGMNKLTLFLATIRDRQQQMAATQKPYIDDLD